MYSTMYRASPTCNKCGAVLPLTGSGICMKCYPFDISRWMSDGSETIKVGRQVTIDQLLIALETLPKQELLKMQEELSKVVRKYLDIHALQSQLNRLNNVLARLESLSDEKEGGEALVLTE